MVEWDPTVAKVVKIMGDKAKVPDIPGTVSKASDDTQKTWADFEKARDAAEDKLLAWENAISSYENAIDQYSAKLAASDLGCDKSSADYKKKRAEAQKLFDAFFKGLGAIAKTNATNGKELNKHMENLSGYKSPPKPPL